MDEPRETPLEPGPPDSSLKDTAFFRAASFAENEVIVTSWFASAVSASGLTTWGGNLILTNERVVFQPLRVPVGRHEVWSVDLRDVTAVELIPRRGRLVRPACVSIESTSAKPGQFVVAPARVTPNWKRALDSVAADCVDVLRTRVGAGPAS